MVASIFTDEEKVRIRAHMGYLNVGQVETFALGMPAAVQTQFMIEGAMDKVLPAAVNRVRRLLGILDTIEQQMLDNMPNMAATEVGEIKIDGKEQEKLKRQYRYWQANLGNVIGISPNPYDQRNGATNQLNVSVQH